jgi:hypothetical protein
MVSSKPIHNQLIQKFFKLVKFQIPSTKLQINLKLQYPMTKTNTAALPHTA